MLEFCNLICCIFAAISKELAFIFGFLEDSTTLWSIIGLNRVFLDRKITLKLMIVISVLWVEILFHPIVNFTKATHSYI